MGYGESSMKTINITHAIGDLRRSLRERTTIPKDLFNGSEFFAQTERQLSLILRVFEKMEKKIYDIENGKEQNGTPENHIKRVPGAKYPRTWDGSN
jgi:hypothetical protein